ncbi:MAG: tRNA pseudouridine(13) synthase TruD, partial [Synergistaceae bacterium]|nr:tRNA pseudouridine(13) synthase TruD [Synergistaceae bacterium]
LLAERGVRLSKFRMKEISQAYFASFPRRCVVVPGDLKCEREEDPLFPGKLAIRTGFFLPRGSYATMLLKTAAAGPVTG